MEVCRVLLEAGAEVDATNIVNKYFIGFVWLFIILICRLSVRRHLLDHRQHHGTRESSVGLAWFWRAGECCRQGRLHAADVGGKEGLCWSLRAAVGRRGRSHYRRQGIPPFFSQYLYTFSFMIYGCSVFSSTEGGRWTGREIRVMTYSVDPGQGIPRLSISWKVL